MFMISILNPRSSRRATMNASFSAATRSASDAGPIFIRLTSEPKSSGRNHRTPKVSAPFVLSFLSITRAQYFRRDLVGLGEWSVMSSRAAALVEAVQFALWDPLLRLQWSRSTCPYLPTDPRAAPTISHGSQSLSSLPRTTREACAVPSF